MKYNTAPTLAAFGVSAGLVLGGCSSTPEQPIPSPSTIPAPTYRPEVTCKQSGTLDMYTQTGWSKDGYVFTVTGIEGSDCVGVYDPQHIEVTLGYLGIGSTFIGPCSPADKPARLHTIGIDAAKQFVGDVNVTTKGSELINTNHIPSCESQGVPQLGTVYPMPPTTVQTPERIPDYCWSDPNLRGCKDF